MKHLRPFLLVLSALAFAGPASAQFFKDGALQALYAADRWADLERTAAQRLAADAGDAQAVLAVGVGAMRVDDAARRKLAIEHAEACLKREPKAAPCHYVLGSVLGVQAMNEGMVSILRNIGRVRAALQEAHTMDAAWYPARSALVEFHLLAPGVAGGSSARALELARSAPTPEQSRALEGRVLLDSKDAARAAQLLSQAGPAADPAVEEDRVAWVGQAALMLLTSGQAEAAKAQLERLLREHPGDALGAYGLGRIASDAGAHADALRRFEQARKLKGADVLPLDYRSGIAQQALGQTEAARASFTRFVAEGKGQRASLEDAKKRLSQLGS